MIIRESAAACSVGEGVMMANALALRIPGSTQTVVDYFPPGGGEWKFELRKMLTEEKAEVEIWVRID